MTEKKMKVLDLDTPPEILIKPSQVEPHKYGIWCKQFIKEGTKFGPFVGEKAYEVDETMDPAFIWEIVDVETKEFLFYINATNPRYGNWMRHINCARYFEEQNIVSEQEGIDIYYHAIKDIQPGEELLTWYEKSPVRKKKGKKKIFPNVKRARTGDESKVVSKSSDHESVSLRGRKRTARKFWEVEEVGMRPATVETQSSSEDELADDDDESKNDDDEGDEDWDVPKQGTVGPNSKSKSSSLAPSATNSGQNSPVPDPGHDASLGTERVDQSEKNKVERPSEDAREYFHFESMVDQGGNGGSHSNTGGSWKNGRRVFRCDICSGVYRHSFSLKRHYVRCHVNFQYLTKVDIIQCGVQPPKLSTNSPSCFDEEDSITQNSSDGTTITATPGSSQNSQSRVESPLEPQGDRQVDKQEDKQGDKQVDKQEDKQGDKQEDKQVDKQADKEVLRVSMTDMYRCNICEQLFDSKEELRYHLSNHPEGEVEGQRQFSCSHCKMQFKHRQNLVRHEVVHTGAKPFSCQQCHKSFQTATNQKRHERIHDGHRLTCDLCPATFTQTGDLKKHASNQHPESYNECAYCSKYFLIELALDAHLKKAHGKDVEANRRRVCVKKKEKKVGVMVLLEKDRAESRRLAIEEAEKKHQTAELPEESYACTVCRKCFFNYSNMCRHRRLAHYKDSKVDDYYDDEDEVNRVVNTNQGQASGTQHGGVSTRSSGGVSVELGYKHFLAVARNIPKNLEVFIEGTRHDLDNAKDHIKWKDPHQIRNEENEFKEMVHTSFESSFASNLDLSLEEYNFPKGFQMATKANLSISEIEDSVVSENQQPLENGRHPIVIKKENDADNKFLVLCSTCRMNFADKKGYVDHLLNCTSIDFAPKSKKMADDMHDYSRKPNPKEEACKIFPELSKLPKNLFSDEDILDLSKHKKCIYTGQSDGVNGVDFPCTVPSEQPLDLTGPKQKEIPPPRSADETDLSVHEKSADPEPKNTSIESSVAARDQNAVKPRKFICQVCYMNFNDKEAAVEHQELKHGNVDCRLAEVDDDFDVSMLKTPKPVGLLSSSHLILINDKPKDEVVENVEEAVNTQQIDGVEQTEVSIEESTDFENLKAISKEDVDDANEKHLEIDTSLKQDLELDKSFKEDDNDFDASNKSDDVSTEELLMTVVSEANEVDAAFGEDAVVCTKCHRKFANLASLHDHISENCGDYWRNLSERVSWVFVLRGNLVQPEKEQPSSTNQPKKRGKFKWQQTPNPPLFRSNSANEDSVKKQNQSTANSRTIAAAIDTNRKLVGNKVLTRKRSQEIGATVVSGMEDPDYYVRSKRRAIMQQQNAANGKRGIKRQTSLDTSATKAEGSDSNQANSSLDEDMLANLSGDGFNDDLNDDDDDYDPNKFMCIYCGHQFQYTRTLRKHVLEFCHVRRGYVEKGEYLDLEWEEDLASKVQPPPPVTPAASESVEENEETKKSGGRKRKRRSWCSRPSNSAQKQPLASQGHDLNAGVKHHNYPPVQSFEETWSQPMANGSIPMTTPGGTIVLKADDVHESDLMGTCDSIPNEDLEFESYQNNLSNSSIASKDLTMNNTSNSGIIFQSDAILSANSSLVQLDLSTLSTANKKPATQQHETSHNSINSQTSEALEINFNQLIDDANRFEDDDEEEEDQSMGLMMTVTSSPAANHAQDHQTWESFNKRRSTSPMRKKRKLSLDSIITTTTTAAECFNSSISQTPNISSESNLT